MENTVLARNIQKADTVNYKEIFDYSLDAILVIKPSKWTVFEANQRGSELLGVGKEELIGMPFPQFRGIYQSLKNSASPVVISEVAFPVKEGHLLHTQVTSKFIEINEHPYILSYIKDMTEQNELAAKLVNTDKLVQLGQLSAGVAHEIRNPLAAVNLNLQQMKRKTELTNPLYGYINKAMQGVERITRIVDLTLNFSKQAKPDIHPTDINGLVLQTLELADTMIKRKYIELEIELDEMLPEVDVDGKQIQQAVLNLITNASEAIKVQGTITVSTYVEKIKRKKDMHYVVIAVKDDGIGIAAEDLVKIFDPFFTRKTEGTGLGLAITQKVIHQNNGVIAVESKYGMGSKFMIKLPYFSQMQ